MSDEVTFKHLAFGTDVLTEAQMDWVSEALQTVIDLNPDPTDAMRCLACLVAGLSLVIGQLQVVPSNGHEIALQKIAELSTHVLERSMLHMVEGGEA